MKLHFYLLYLSFVVSLRAQVNLDSSLTACYSLNGNAIDQVNALNGTLSSVTNTVSRFNQLNSAMAFNGSTLSYIELPNSPLLKAPEVSFSAWVRFNHINTHQYIVFTHNGCLNYHEGYMLAINNWVPGGFRLQMAKADNSCSFAGQATLNGTQVLNAGVWYHVGFYAGADSLKLYLNGALESTLSNSNQLLYNPLTKVYLGGSNVSIFNPSLDGCLDNVRFYNRKLNGSEMQALFTQDPECRMETVGLSRLTVESHWLNIFPNPVEDWLNFTIKPPYGSADYYIENSCGQKIQVGNLNINCTSCGIDCSSLAQGLHFFRLTNNGESVVKKFIKQ